MMRVMFPTVRLVGVAQSRLRIDSGCKSLSLASDNLLLTVREQDFGYNRFSIASQGSTNSSMKVTK